MYVWFRTRALTASHLPFKRPPCFIFLQQSKRTAKCPSLRVPAPFLPLCMCVWVSLSLSLSLSVSLSLISVSGGMLKQRHLRHAAGATPPTALHAAADYHSSSPSGCSPQQAAAAWAWFEHGGSTCITPRKAEGLVAAKRRAKQISAGLSRFRKEYLISRKTLQDDQMVQPGAAEAITEAGHSRRRHSFHNDDSTDRSSYMYWRFRSSCRSVVPSLLQIDINKIADQNEAEDEESGSISCQDDASSLLDKFEVDAVRRQLRDYLKSYAGRHTCSSPRRSTRSVVEPQEYLDTQKAYNDHPHRTNLKPHRYLKSTNAAAQKPIADNVYHHINIHDGVHRLLHMHIKTKSRNSTSVAPALCRSIATADSIVGRHRHHHQPASPKKSTAVSPINKTKKRHGSVSDADIKHNYTGRVSHSSAELKINQAFTPADERLAAADHEHERGDSTLKPVQRKSQQKAPRRSDVERIACASTQSRLHRSDSVYSKALLAHKSNAADQHSRGDDRSMEEYTDKHEHLHEHHHIHHHHHHFHLLQQIGIHEASHDALWPQDRRRIMDGKDGAGRLQVISKS